MTYQLVRSNIQWVLCVLGNVSTKLIKFKKNTLAISTECQTVWIQIRPNTLSGLIWAQTVCKGYQLTALRRKEVRVRSLLDPYFLFLLHFLDNHRLGLTVIITLENLCTRKAQSSRGVRSRRVHKIYYFGLL